MKKVLALLLAIIMVFALAACGQSAKQAEAPADEEAAAAEAEPEEAPVEEESAEAPDEEEPEEAPDEEEEPAEPDGVLRFTTADSDGDEWTDEAFANAKVTMLNEWAYWCPPCVGEMPDLQRLYENYADQGFQILGVSYEEYEADNVQLMEDLGITYPCLRMTDSIEEYLNTGYVPSTIFVDSEGNVLGEAIVGPNTYEGWAEIIEGYLN